MCLQQIFCDALCGLFRPCVRSKCLSVANVPGHVHPCSALLPPPAQGTAPSTCAPVHLCSLCEAVCQRAMSKAAWAHSTHSCMGPQHTQLHGPTAHKAATCAPLFVLLVCTATPVVTTHRAHAPCVQVPDGGHGAAGGRAGQGLRRR